MGLVISKVNEVKQKMKQQSDIDGFWTHELEVCDQLPYNLKRLSHPLYPKSLKCMNSNQPDTAFEVYSFVS